MQAADYKRVPVSSPSGTVYALVDADDYAWLAGFTWSLTRGYATRHRPRPDRGTITMARAILGLERGDPREADHKNRDRLDNRRSNLRVVTHAVNGRNVPSQQGTSRYRGVCWDTRKRKWLASAQYERVHTFIGLFADEDAAAAAVNDFWLGKGCEAPNAVAQAA